MKKGIGIYINMRPVNSLCNTDLKAVVKNEFIKSPQWVTVIGKTIKKA